MNPMQMFDEYQKFQREFVGKNQNMNPRDVVQKLLNDGKATPQMLEQARAMAAMVGVKL
jgi:hypothetical protein